MESMAWAFPSRFRQAPLPLRFGAAAPVWGTAKHNHPPDGAVAPFILYGRDLRTHAHPFL